MAEPLAKVTDKRGLALFEEIIEEIEAHEFRTWDQTLWLGHNDDEDAILKADLAPTVQETLIPEFDCGTVGCLFGHAVFKAGARLLIQEGYRFDGSLGEFGTDVRVPDRDQISSSHVLDPLNGGPRSIERWAAELLDLDGILANWLSDGSRTWMQIVVFRDAWRVDAAAGPGRDEARWAVIQATSSLVDESEDDE